MGRDRPHNYGRGQPRRGLARVVGMVRPHEQGGGRFQRGQKNGRQDGCGDLSTGRCGHMEHQKRMDNGMVHTSGHPVGGNSKEAG